MKKSIFFNSMGWKQRITDQENVSVFMVEDVMAGYSEGGKDNP